MRVGRAAVAAVVAGSLAAACGGSSGSNRLNDPNTLASAIRGSAQHKLDSGTSGLPAGTKVTQVTCVSTQRLNYSCDVHFDAGPDRTIQVAVSPGGRSYVVTAGDL